MSTENIFLLVLNLPSNNIELQKIIAKHMHECYEIRKKNVGNSQLRLENYRICKFIWNTLNVPCTRYQIKYVCMYVLRSGVGGGGYSQKNWVGVFGPLPKTLTLFMTKICDFSYPIYDLIKNLIPYLCPDHCISLYFTVFLRLFTGCFGLKCGLEYSKSMSGQLQFKNPGGPARDRTCEKPLRHVHSYRKHNL